MKKHPTVYHPESFDELDNLIHKLDAPAVFIAGATDLMVRRDDWRSNDTFIDLTGLTDLCSKITLDRGKATIGAGVPLSDLIHHKKLTSLFPMLVAACRQIGSVQIQNRATLGGNIANASPAGDTLPVLAAYDTRLQIGPKRSGSFESIPLEEVMLGPGKTILEGNRYIAAIDLPVPEGSGQFWYFRKVGPRHAMAISKVSLAVYAQMEGKRITDIRIAAGSVTPQIKRARETEAVLLENHLTDKLIEEAADKIRTEIDPITDIRSTREYRRQTCRALLAEALMEIKKSDKATKMNINESIST